MVSGARLIVILRNPVDRAYSHYHHRRASGREPLETFEKAVAAEPKRLAGEHEKVLLGERSEAHQHHSYLSKGLYAEQIRRWRRCYSEITSSGNPSEALLVLCSEDFYGDPQPELRRALEHIFWRDQAPVRDIPLREVDFRSRNELSYPPMDSGTRRRLQEHFEPYNNELYEMIGRDFGW